MTAATVAPPAMLRLPAPRDLAESRIAHRLGGHVLSRQWLPPTWPELADVRAEHARLLERAGGVLAELGEAEASFRREDRDHVMALQAAARAGQPMPEDARTPDGERAAHAEEILDEVWAVAAVLADVVDGALAHLRRQEDEILGRLRGERAEAEDQRREAERLLAQAKTVEWQLHKQAAWLLATAEDGPLSRQPAPTPSVPPDTFSEVVLERPWHRERPPVPPPVEPDEPPTITVNPDGSVS